MSSVHFSRGYTANALIPSQESRFRPLPKQLQPPFLSRVFSSHSNALRTFGWSAYPKRTSARAMFPVVHRWPRFVPLIENPPSSIENFRIQRVHALSMRGSALVRPRSARIRSIQFVDRYFGV